MFFVWISGANMDYSGCCCMRHRLLSVVVLLVFLFLLVPKLTHAELIKEGLIYAGNYTVFSVFPPGVHTPTLSTVYWQGQGPMGWENESFAGWKIWKLHTFWNTLQDEIEKDYVPNNIGANNIKMALVPYNIKMKLVSYNTKIESNTRLNNCIHEILSVIFILF